MTTALLVPVKGFAQAKVRLAPVLSGPDRAELARRMAAGVLDAGTGLARAVVCDDPEVAAWAERRGVEVLWRPGHGLNPAVTSGVAALSGAGHDRVVVAHADLPLARDLAEVAAVAPGGITLVPDRHAEGTNVIALPAASGFSFAYGRGSFARHRAEAERLGLAVEVINDPALGWDIDTAADLEVPATLGPSAAVGDARAALVRNDEHGAAEEQHGAADETSGVNGA